MELSELFKENPVISHEISEILRKKNNKEPLQEFGKEKIESLKKAIREIKDSIKEREKLSQEFCEECEKIKTEINNFLIENQGYIGGGGYERDKINEKSDLRSQKVEISQSQINEKINSWKDIAMLKKELRDKERELKEKEARIKEINKILNEDDEK